MSLGDRFRLLFTTAVLALSVACSGPESGSLADMREVQLTTAAKGHFLHTTQQFSPDGQWIVYDTRNDGAHIGRTCCIEMVHTATGEVRRLYTTEGQTAYGPGVGGATFNPQAPEVLFIHGLQNCDSIRPYGFSRRTGVLIRADAPQQPVFLDARDVTPPFTPGALRGGTHAHTWSADGQWVSFTYNDDVMAQLSKQERSRVEDLRMVGVMASYGPVEVSGDTTGEKIDGRLFSVVVTEVTENPAPGSDEVSRAYEDGWVGEEGYLRLDGSRQRRAVAFLGDVRDGEGKKLTEVFVADLPDDMTVATPGAPLEGTAGSRPMPPAGTRQRRLTFTVDRKYPGVQGPRHWLRSLPDGSLILFMMKDEEGRVQVYGVSPNGGAIEQITDNDFSIETSFNVSPDGRWLVYGSQGIAYITDVSSGRAWQASPTPPEGTWGMRAPNFSHDGTMIVYNRKVEMVDSSYYQVFLLKPGALKD